MTQASPTIARRRSLARPIQLALLVLLGLLVTHASPAQADRLSHTEVAQLRLAASAIDELRLEDADALLGRLVAAHADDPDVLFEHGLLAYHRGDYQRARREMLGSVVRATGRRSANERYDLARIAFDTEQATRGFATTRSEDGRFVVRHASADAPMVGYALDVLRRVDAGLEQELGYRHPGPILLEILPSTALLSRVSSLSVEEIETTGTIALCKWDRLIITSPRALVYGYAWADTVAHEYVHLVLARMTNDRAPVWVQEGYARFLERRWRGGPPHVVLDPRSAGLLSEAASSDRLLPFERLHPSIARLPSAELAALAFAQVSTFVESFYEARGQAGLRDVAARVAAGVDARDAFAQASGRPWADLERSWREGLRRRGPETSEAENVPLRFRHGEEDDDDTDEVARGETRDAVRLGDMLFVRSRHRAARHEYERAFALAPENPVVATRLARAAYASGDPARALEVLEPLRARYPEHAPLLALIAVSAAQEGRGELAEEAGLESIWQNPFDPEPQCAIAAFPPDAALGAIASSACDRARR